MMDQTPTKAPGLKRTFMPLPARVKGQGGGGREGGARLSYVTT